MTDRDNNRPASDATSPLRGSIGRWAVIAVLVFLLIAAGVIGYLGWISGGDTAVPTSGYVAMALGVIFSLVIGVGLMALLFYSSRKGYDEPARLIEDPDAGADQTGNDRPQG